MTDKQAEELARENARLKGDLLTISTRISHDLRTPLGNILNSAELLKEVLAEHDVPAGSLESIFTSVDELMRLIKSTSLIARATSTPSPAEHLNMSEAVYHAWQRGERQILKRGATVEMADAWPDVDGVRDWLQFVWWSFLSNALEHGGKHIVMGWQKHNQGHKFFVRDSGDGVRADRRAKLFQPFNELHRLNGAKGLGLAMAQRLVELQKGACGYEFDDGAIFYFVLPAAKTAERNVMMNLQEAT